jgi:hypothetical protein
VEWWGCLDSNQGTQRERIYSPPQLPLCHIPIFRSQAPAQDVKRPLQADGILRAGIFLVNRKFGKPFGNAQHPLILHNLIKRESISSMPIFHIKRAGQPKLTCALTWSWWPGSNRRQLVYKTRALPTELHQREEHHSAFAPESQPQFFLLMRLTITHRQPPVATSGRLGGLQPSVRICPTVC